MKERTKEKLSTAAFVLIAGLALGQLLNACGFFKGSPCTEPLPKVSFRAGDLATLKTTGEPVRITSKHVLLTSVNGCGQRTYGMYTVRFTDGSKTEASWRQLAPRGRP